MLTFCVSRKDFLKLRLIAKKSGVSLKITGKSGLIYKYRKYNKRIGLVTGVLLFAAIHLVLSMFVWCTDVEGNNKISKSEILTVAEHYGLRSGTMKKGFDEILAARKIAADFDGNVTWLSINIKGSLAVIELREDNPVIPGAEDKPPCNIVADFDGVILSDETFYGDRMVESGTGVRKGDMLINGAIINEDMSTTFYTAKGRMTALHEKEIVLSSKLGKNTDSIEIVDEGCCISVFGLELQFLRIKKDESLFLLKEKKTLNINGYDLPFSVEKILVCRKNEAVFCKNTEYISELEKIQSSIYVGNRNSTVVSCDEKLSLSRGRLTFDGKYTLIDFIGEEKPILSVK